MTVPDGPGRWRTSTRSNNGGNCVEVAFLAADRVAVRDSRNPAGPVLVFAGRLWRAFLRDVRSGRYDLPPAGAGQPGADRTAG